tara:strand:+ start:458 stop:895 length:438 start_codon:yes stop_codon:yes gene_type:complete
MNKIQQAMHNKANNALGEVEYQIDLFLDNNCKSSFKMDKYLTQLDFKKKLVLIMRDSFNPLLEEITSEEEDFVEAYSFLTIPQKKRFVKFVMGLQEGCDKYIAKNEATWKADSERKRFQKKMRKAHNERIAQIEASTGYKKRKLT